MITSRATIASHTATAASGLAALLALAFIFGANPASWLGATLLLTCIVSGVGAALSGRLLAQEWQRVQQFQNQLCQSDFDLVADGAGGCLPNLPPDSTWLPVCQRLDEVFTDKTRRLREAEQSRTALEIRIRRNEAQTQKVAAILANLPEPVVAIEGYEELLMANHNAERLFGLAPGAPGTVEKRALAQLAHCEKLVDLLRETRRRKTPTQRTSELEIAGSDGASQWYSVTARSFGEEHEGGGPDGADSKGAVAVLRDISFQKTIQKRNAQFVSDVSHEMKTPLAGIKAYVELLLDGEADDKKSEEEFLNVINSQANRLQRLVDNLLNLARIEAGVVAVSKQSRSLNELLEEACQVIQPAADAKSIHLLIDLSPLYLSVLADRDMLLQAAINLLSNAVKYTAAGGQVTLRSRMDDAYITFEVEDTGVGLGPEDCQKVFEKFYRVQKDKDMASGTGLGLPLAKHIVEDVHGGRLTVRSKLGQGSTFAVSLPSAAQLQRTDV